MLIYHASDLHYCEKHLSWVDKAFRAGCDHAIEQGAQAAVLSGDSFDDTINLHHPAVGAFIRNVRTLADYMPVFILQGTFSHDRPGCLEPLRHLRGNYPVYVSERAERVYLVADRDGPQVAHPKAWLASAAPLPEVVHSFGTPMLSVCSLPSVNRAALKAREQDLGTALQRQFDEWAAGNAQARAAGIPTVLVSHGTVNGCVTESKQAMVSPDHEFGTAALFSAGADAVMLGHIHEHQGWEYEGRRIAYPGSITRLIYGHTSPTGCLLWQVEPGRSDYRFEPLPARRLVDIEFNGPPDLAVLKARLADCGDSYVRVRYQVDEEHRGAVDTAGMRQFLRDAGVADFKIEGKINPVQRTRAAGISREASIEARIKRWCEITNTPAEPLLDRYAQLLAGG